MHMQPVSPIDSRFRARCGPPAQGYPPLEKRRRKAPLLFVSRHTVNRRAGDEGPGMQTLPRSWAAGSAALLTSRTRVFAPSCSLRPPQSPCRKTSGLIIGMERGTIIGKVRLISLNDDFPNRFAFQYRPLLPGSLQRVCEASKACRDAIICCSVDAETAMRAMI